MRKVILTTLAAAGMISAAAPALAYATPHRAENIRTQIAQLDRTINRSDWHGRVSDREATRLRNDLASIHQRFQRYNYNGLSPSEMRDLDHRIQGLRNRLQMDKIDTRRHH